MNLALRPFMRLKIGPSLLAIALVGAAGFALFQRSGAAGATREPGMVPSPAATAAPGSEAFSAKAPESDSFGSALPPNHPAINSRGTSDRTARDEAAALAWTPPSSWEVTPSRSTIRIATYRVPGVKAGGAGAELTVARAGGSTEDNLERWAGQFEDAGRETRASRTISGLRVTTLEVSGTYDGGMSSAGPETSRPGWSLLGAVIETSGPFYFFKMVGPTGAVRAARPAFEELVSSVRKPI